MARLQLDENFSTSASLVEWSERLRPTPECSSGALPSERLDVTVKIVSAADQLRIDREVQQGSSGRVDILSNPAAFESWDAQEWGLEYSGTGTGSAWRLITMEAVEGSPAGGGRWTKRLEALRNAAKQTEIGGGKQGGSKSGELVCL